MHQPPVCRMTPAILAKDLNAAGLRHVLVDGIEPWKVLFFYPQWYKRWNFTHQMAYLSGRILRFVPIPRVLRAQMAVQILAVGQKV